MTSALGDEDFYQNLLNYMNQGQNTQNQFTFSTPASFSPHETEKHSLDEDDTVMDEGDSKRRESNNSNGMDSGSDETDSKPRKKPGRKMMMTEPANKRKAQNRAAQRAFRERKEAHVKNLETRVTELEEITESKETENANLKSQVQALQAELMTLRGGNFNFDFGIKNVQNPNVLTNNTTNIATVRNPFAGQPNGQQSSPSPSSGNATDASSIFRSGQTSLATSPENDITKNGTPNIDIPFDLFSNSAGPANFSNNTSPLFNTDLFGTSPAPQNGTLSAAPLFAQNISQSPVDSFAQTLASLTQNQATNNLSNGFNTSMSSTSTAPLSTFTPTSNANVFDMNDPLFNTWRDNSISSSGPDESNFDIFDTMFSSMSPGAFNLVDSTGLTDFITDSPVTQPPLTANGEQAMPCPELWEKVKNHPQFDDLDIDQLCAELRSKAKCSNTAAFSAREMDETLSRFVKS